MVTLLSALTKDDGYPLTKDDGYPLTKDDGYFSQVIVRRLTAAFRPW